MKTSRTAAEAVGWIGGWALAPFTGAVSFLRRARMFHPDGHVYRAEVIGVERDGELAGLAERLAGPALVRFSSAWWRGEKEWVDALGCALRFRSVSDPSPEPAPTDQDLLFATIRSPWTTMLAPLTTNQHSFIDNDYYAVSPFDCDGIGRVKWRLRAPRLVARGVPRAVELAREAAAGHVVLRLELKRLRRGARWEPVAEIRLGDAVTIDQAALRFSPFRSGRGIKPRGLVHALRAGAYRASQRARPSRGP